MSNQGQRINGCVRAALTNTPPPPYLPAETVQMIDLAIRDITTLLLRAGFDDVDNTMVAMATRAAIMQIMRRRRSR